MRNEGLRVGVHHWLMGFGENVLVLRWVKWLPDG